MLKKLFMKRLGKNQKGVTLVELMAVVVILGIIAGVAGAAVTGAFSNAKTTTDQASIRIIKDAAQRYYMDTSDKDIDVKADLVTKGYLTDLPKPQAASMNSFKVTVTEATATTPITITVAPDAANYQ